MLLGTTGCGGDEFADRTAEVTVDGETTKFELDACGLDGETVFVVGRTDGGAVLQAVVGVTFLSAPPEGGTAVTDESAVPDGDPVPNEEAVPESSGLTVDVDDVTWASFGAEAWARRDGTGPAPGSVTSARVRGARIQLSGQATQLDAAGQPETVPIELDARCDDPD